jgi:hypothetical protein
MLPPIGDRESKRQAFRVARAEPLLTLGKELLGDG